MSKKFSPSRKRAFLTYLSQTGNIGLSAERAKVSRSWVTLHRSGDAAFDAACRGAIAEAKAALRQAQDERLRHAPHPDRPSPQPSPASGRGSKWRYLDGVELVVSGSNGRRTQVRRARVKQWTPHVEARFLSALTATCNVKAACAEVGMWPPSAYNHRKRWPAFADAWDAAIDIGYARIEAALVEAGCNLFSDRDPELGSPIRGMTAAEAIQLLHMHKHAVRGLGKRPGQPERRPTNGEVADALQKALERMEREVRLGIGPWGRAGDGRALK